MQELRAWILAVVIGAVACAPAAAQSAAPHYDLTWHGSILAGAVLGSGLIVLAERNDTATCRWCGVDAQGRPSVPGIDDWGHAHLAWHNEERAT
ncbi:MAG TPA: hypothetical protein VMW48_00715, partial [Vicinamibacterales bacterium]|nr:hypothetical protein [Vicinamibacterales bacterium]